MTASCLSCNKSRQHGGDLVCDFHDNARVRPGYVCLSWCAAGGQGSFYGSPVIDRRESQQEHAGEDRRGSHGVRVVHDAERFESGSYVIPGQTAMGGSK